MSYIRYLCLFAHSGVEHILCCVFVLLSLSILPVSLDCPFLIGLLVFSNDYLHIPNKRTYLYITPNSNMASFFRFVDKRTIYRWYNLFAHAPVNVTLYGTNKIDFYN